MADEIVQVIRLQGQEAVASDLQRMSAQGQQAFQRLTNAAEQISQVDFDGLRNKLNQISNVNLPAVVVAAERTRNSLVALSKQAGQELDFSKPIEKSKQEISDLGSTSVSVFGAISNSIGTVISGFEKLTSVITGSKVALSTAAIGGGLILGLNSLKNAIVGFSDASLADKLQSVLGDTVKKAVTEVDKHQKELTEKTEHLKHDTISTTSKKTEDISIPETKALTDLKKAIADTRIEVQSMQGEDDLLNTGLTELQIKALGTANAFKEMQSELDFTKSVKPIDKLIESFTAFGVKQEVIKKQIRDFAIGIESQFEKVKKIQEDEASKSVKSSLDVASALLNRKSSVESLKGAELSLIEAEERFRIARGGDKNPDLEKRIKLERDEIAVEEAGLRVKQAKIAQAQADQAVIDAQKKASEEQANSLTNIVRYINNLTNSVTVIGPKINATAENIAHGFVASLGSGVKSIKLFSGSLDDLDRNAPQLVPIFEKLADLFKGTGDSALNARIANILFSGSIDDNLLKALSKGKKGLEDARNLAKTITDLQKDFSSANLLRFGEQLLKISDIEERTKKSTDILGDTFGKLFSESISNNVGSLRQAVAPFDSVIQTFNTNIKQADLFKKSVDGLKESFLAAGISSKRSTLDFGLLISPAAIPIIDAIAKGVRELKVDFGKLASDIGSSIKPIVEDFFTILSGKGNQIESNKLGSSIGKSINETIIPAFVQLKEIIIEVGKTLGSLFGTGDISASVIAFGTIITALIGPFTALGIAILAVFGSNSPAIKSFKENLKSFGIDIDAIKKKINEFFADLKSVFGGANASQLKNPWIKDIVDSFKTLPGIILELGVFTAAIARFVGPANLAKAAILGWTGALDIFLKGLAAISLTVFTVLNSLKILELGVGAIAAIFGLTKVAALGWIGAFIAGVVVIVKNIDSILPSIKRIVDAFSEKGISSGLKQIAEEIKSAFIKLLDSNKEAFFKWVDIIDEKLKQFTEDVKQFFSDAFGNIWDGLVQGFDTAIEQIKTKAEELATWLKEHTVIPQAAPIPGAAGPGGTIPNVLNSNPITGIIESLKRLIEGISPKIQEKPASSDDINRLTSSEDANSGEQVSAIDRVGESFENTSKRIENILQKIFDKLPERPKKPGDTGTGTTTESNEIFNKNAGNAGINRNYLLDQIAEDARFSKVVEGSISKSLPDQIPFSRNIEDRRTQEQIEEDNRPRRPRYPEGPQSFTSKQASNDILLNDKAFEDIVSVAGQFRVITENWEKFLSSHSSTNVENRKDEPISAKGAPADDTEEVIKNWIADQLRVSQAGNLPKDIGNEDVSGSKLESASEIVQSAFEQLTAAADMAAEAMQKIGSWSPSSGIAEERAAGGYISGPGSGTSDSIPARLSNGEYVVRASAVRNVGVGFMHAINNFSVGGLVGNISDRMNNLLPRFATGGIVASQSGPLGGLHPVTINFEGRKVGGLYAPGNVIRDMHAASVSNQISSTGRKPGHYR